MYLFTHNGNYPSPNELQDGSNRLSSSYDGSKNFNSSLFSNTGLNTNDWQYMSASVPSGMQGPLTFPRQINTALPSSWNGTGMQNGSNSYSPDMTQQLEQPMQLPLDNPGASPRSASSTESNLVSPPQEYYPAPMGYPNSLNPSTTEVMIPSFKPTHLRRRSSSLPPGFHSDIQPSIQPNSQQVAPMKPQLIPIERVPQPRMDPAEIERQREHNDRRLEKLDFEDITVAELKDILRQRGLSCGGRKSDLVDRLRSERELMLNNRRLGLHQRVANLSLGEPTSKMRMPKRQPRSPFSPYYSSSPPTRSPINTAMNPTRMASSLDTNWRIIVSEPGQRPMPSNTDAISPQGPLSASPIMFSPFLDFTDDNIDQSGDIDIQDVSTPPQNNGIFDAQFLDNVQSSPNGRLEQTEDTSWDDDWMMTYLNLK